MPFPEFNMKHAPRQTRYLIAGQNCTIGTEDRVHCIGALCRTVLDESIKPKQDGQRQTSPTADNGRWILPTGGTKQVKIAQLTGDGMSGRIAEAIGNSVIWYTANVGKQPYTSGRENSIYLAYEPDKIGAIFSTPEKIRQAEYFGLYEGKTDEWPDNPFKKTKEAELEDQIKRSTTAEQINQSNGLINELTSLQITIAAWDQQEMGMAHVPPQDLFTRAIFLLWQSSSQLIFREIAEQYNPDQTHLFDLIEDVAYEIDSDEADVLADAFVNLDDRQSELWRQIYNLQAEYVNHGPESRFIDILTPKWGIPSLIKQARVALLVFALDASIVQTVIGNEAALAAAKNTPQFAEIKAQMDQIIETLFGSAVKTLTEINSGVESKQPDWYKPMIQAPKVASQSWLHQNITDHVWRPHNCLLLGYIAPTDKTAEEDYSGFSPPTASLTRADSIKMARLQNQNQYPFCFPSDR